MTREDPFFAVKDEVAKAVTRTRGLYQRWCELQEDASVAVGREELVWIATELKNSLRSIEWDLEDLEETITIVEKNPKKFKIDETELKDRKIFVDQTRDDLKVMKDKMNSSRTKERDRQSRQPLLSSSPSTPRGIYASPPNDMDSPNHSFINETMQQQQTMMQSQDEQVNLIKDSMNTLKTMSRQIGQELDEQSIMLDEVSHEMYNTESKLDSTMKKVAKVLHMSNDRRQWVAIGVLSAIMVVVILLLWLL